MRTLINYGMRCGVGASLRALRSHGVSLTRLAAQSGPENVVSHLAGTEQSGALALPLKLHFFSFGGVEKTARWIDAVASGRFRMRGAQFEL
jgi:methylenetetrahydrofolate reductase (NADPH)